MPGKRFTECINESVFDAKFSTSQSVFWSNFWPMLGGLLAGLAAGGALGGAIAGIPGLVYGAYAGATFGMLEGLCEQWLKRRLICVERNVCAIGKIAWTEEVSEKGLLEAAFDNDISINLRLSPYADDFHRVEDDAMYKQLLNEKIALWIQLERKEIDQLVYDIRMLEIEEQMKNRIESFYYDAGQIEKDNFPASVILRKRLNKNYQGYEPDKRANTPAGCWTLHCEFEGSGMASLCAVGKAVAALGPLVVPVNIVVGAANGAYQTAKAVYNAIHDGCKNVCSFPIVCDVVCVAVAAVVAAYAGVYGGIIGAAIGAIPGIGTLQTAMVLGSIRGENGSYADAATDSASGDLHVGDAVLIAGDLVYDAGHPEGWHEIHPALYVQKLPGDCPELSIYDKFNRFYTPEFRNQVQLYWDRWCKGYQTSQDPFVVAAQNEPENQWCFHPLVDGCRKDGEPSARPWTSPSPEPGPVVR